MSEWYQGMTIVYRKGTELDEKLVAIVKILLKMGFKWLWGESNKTGYGLEWHSNKYILKRYDDRDISRLIVYSGAEWLAKVEAKEKKEIEEEDLINKIIDYNKREDRINLYSIPFPPVRYYEKFGIKYDRDNPFPSDDLIINEDGNKVEVYKYKTHDKRAIIVDFWSLHRYFKYSEPPLSVAVENFVLDLMRDIAIETKPEYAYMDLNEYKPLENDPVCDTGKLKLSYYILHNGELEVNCYLSPLMYFDEEIIKKNGGKEFKKYMETKKKNKEIRRIERFEAGVFYHIGDIVIPVDRAQRSYIDIADYLLGDKISDMKKKIKSCGKRYGYICNY